MSQGLMYPGAKQSLVSRAKGQGGRAGQAAGMTILGYAVFLKLPLLKSELELEREGAELAISRVRRPWHGQWRG